MSLNFRDKYRGRIERFVISEMGIFIWTVVPVRKPTVVAVVNGQRGHIVLGMTSPSAIFDGLPVQRDLTTIVGRGEEVLIPSGLAGAVWIFGGGRTGLDAFAFEPVHVPFVRRCL